MNIPKLLFSMTVMMLWGDRFSWKCITDVHDALLACKSVWFGSILDDLFSIICFKYFHGEKAKAKAIDSNQIWKLSELEESLLHFYPKKGQIKIYCDHT